MVKMLTRKRVLAAKAETTEGTEEVPAVGDAKLLVVDPKHGPDVPYHKRNPARGTISPLPGLPGKQSEAFNFGIEMRGQGAAATAPQWGLLLQACGFQQIDPWQLDAPGGDWSGAFVAGERVTQAVSLAVGIVMFDTAITIDLIVMPVSGTFDATNLCTGAVSASTGIPAVAAQSVAIGWRPSSDFSTAPSLTLHMYDDGVLHKMIGARGNVSFSGTAGEVFMANFEFQGVMLQPTDTALIAPVHETTRPPTFLGVTAKLHADYEAIFQELGMNMNNEVVERPNAGKTTGIESFLITGRAPQVTIDPEMDLIANHDFMSKLRLGTEGNFEFVLGSVVGNTLKFGAPKVQYVQISDDDRSGLTVAGLTMDASSYDTDGDDEIVILQT